jgi:hypothetical protein
MKAVMEHASTIGLDPAKRVFQLHGAGADGSVAFCKKLSRAKLLAFLAAQPRCIVAMKACAPAHVKRLADDQSVLPWLGRRSCRACSSVSSTRLACIERDTYQPTIRRAKASITKAT